MPSPAPDPMGPTAPSAPHEPPGPHGPPTLDQARAALDRASAAWSAAGLLTGENTLFSDPRILEALSSVSADEFLGAFTAGLFAGANVLELGDDQRPEVVDLVDAIRKLAHALLEVDDGDQ